LKNILLFPLAKCITPHNYQKFSHCFLNRGSSRNKVKYKVRKLKNSFEKKKKHLKKKKLVEIFKQYSKPTSKENKDIIEKIKKWVKQIKKGQIEPFDKSVMK